MQSNMIVHVNSHTEASVHILLTSTSPTHYSLLITYTYTPTFPLINTFLSFFAF